MSYSKLVRYADGPWVDRIVCYSAETLDDLARISDFLVTPPRILPHPGLSGIAVGPISSDHIGIYRFGYNVGSQPYSSMPDGPGFPADSDDIKRLAGGRWPVRYEVWWWTGIAEYHAELRERTA